jgi:hypothetical protein
MAQLDALIEISPLYTRILTLTPRAHHWVEMHVTLAQVQTWTEGVLEVAPCDITDLLTDMLRAGLRLAPVCGRMNIRRSHVTQNALVGCLSAN